MIAAIYAQEIAAQFRCTDCAKDPSLWERRGRCTGEIPDGFEQLTFQIRVGKGETRTGMFPGPDGDREGINGWASCPMGWLREDLRPDEVAVARMVGSAVAAEHDRAWPLGITNRMYRLIQIARATDAERDRTRHERERELTSG